MMQKTNKKSLLRRRHLRIRARVEGTADQPRLAVSRSSRFIQVQLIDDTHGVTLLGMHDSAIKLKGTKTERAGKLGAQFSAEAKNRGIKKVVFDRGGYRYHGRIRAFAEALRKGGLEF